MRLAGLVSGGDVTNHTLLLLFRRCAAWQFYPLLQRYMSLGKSCSLLC